MKKDNHRADETDGGADNADQSQHSEQSNEARAADGEPGQTADTEASCEGEADHGPSAQDGEPRPPAASSRSGAVLASISLIAVIAAIAAGFGVWRQSDDRQQRLVEQVKEAQSSANAAQSSTDDLKRGLATVGDSVESLGATVKSLKSTIESSSSQSRTGLTKRVTAVEKQIQAVQGDIKANSQGIGEARRTIKSVQGTLAALATNVASLQSSVKSVSGQINAVDGKLSSRLDSAVSGLQQTRKSLTQLRDQVSKRADGWMIEDAEYLVRVASQRLQLAGDTRTAIRALEGAEQRLKAMGDPSLLQVRKKVTDDIVALQAVPRPDITGMALTLSGLAKKVDDLPVAGVNPGQVMAAHNGAGGQARTKAEGWSGFWTRFWSQLKSLVVIRHEGSSSEALVPPDQRFFLKENLKLKLEAARLALLREDYKAFHDALDTADQWLGQYFKTDAPAVEGMRKSLKELADAKVQPQLPDLSGTLKALRDWRASHMNQSAALDVAPGRGQAAGTA